MAEFYWRCSRTSACVFMLLWSRVGRQTGWKWKRNNLHFLWQNKNKTNKLGYAASQPWAVCFFYLGNVSPSPSSHPIGPLRVSQLPPDSQASLNRHGAIKAGWFYPQSKRPKSDRGHCVRFKRDKALFFPWPTVWAPGRRPLPHWGGNQLPRDYILIPAGQ